MKRNDENNHEKEWLEDIPVQSENIAFEAREMLACAACGRTNPPTRLKCFYCAAELENNPAHPKTGRTSLRKPENWEKGFNLILVENTSNEIDFRRIAGIVNLEAEAARKIIQSNKHLPILRTESEREATIVQTNLIEFGLKTKIVSDDLLAAENAPGRLRGLEFEGGKIILILFNTDEIVEIASEDLILLVQGTIFERKTEAIEKRKKGGIEILESTDSGSDEQLIDLYSRNDSVGYRILVKGFDFSGLEAEKGLLAAKNLKKLTVKLREFAPQAKLIDDYLAVREILGNIWEIEHRRDAKGLKRHSFSKFDFANVESSSNLQQFTKYSRLQRQIL